MDTIEALRMFVRVVETGSLTAVARELNTSQSTISRQITQLEEHFGVRLLHRTTRNLSLTDDGEGLHAHARSVLELVEGMETSLGHRKTSPTGHVRVAIPVSLGMMLMPQLPLLIAKYPGLSIDLVMQDHAGDMIEDRLDLAIRSGEVSNPGLIKRSLGNVVRIAVASPDYLERRDLPELPDQLIHHECIVHRITADGSEWRLIGPEGPSNIAVQGAVSTDNHDAARVAALSGLGIALLPEYQVVDDIEAGRLHRVLPAYTSEDLPAFVVYPSRRNLAPRTRVVMDFLIDEVHRLRSRQIDSITPLLAPAIGTRNHGAAALFVA